MNILTWTAGAVITIMSTGVCFGDKYCYLAVGISLLVASICMTIEKLVK